MPTFAIYRGGALLRRVSLDNDVIKVGRLASGHIVLDDDPKVSRMHAVIENEAGALSVVDLGSDLGTLVNGKKVAKSALTIGDRITVGDTTLVIENGDRVTSDGIGGSLRLPTPTLIQNELDDAFSPEETFATAALVLQVDGVRREAWSANTELAVALFESYPRGAAPQPDIMAPSRSHKLIDDAAGTETRRCSNCAIRPGMAPCAVCAGNGSGSSSDVESRCYACNGEGFLRCGACDGTTRVVGCSIRYINDEPVRIRRVLVPQIHASIRSFVEARLHAEASWPDAQAIDPEPSLVASAYRGASAVRASEEFHGFYFGDALAACLVAREEATTGLARFNVRTYAVPVLWTITRERHAAYFYDDRGALQTVSG